MNIAGNKRVGGGTDYLSIINTNCIKGIFALFVLTHHLYQHSGLFRESQIGTVFQGLGYLSVAMFFFLSGYGLRFSHITKGFQYVNSMPIKRILPLYLQSLILIALYTCLSLIIGKEVKSSLLLQSVFWGNTIIANGWYLQVILVLYVLYYLVYGVLKTEKMNDPNFHITMLVVLIVYAWINIFLGKSIMRYQSIFAFWLGLIWSDYKNWLDKILNKYWGVSVIIGFIAFSILFVAGLKNRYFTILAALSFVILTIILFMRIPVNFSVTRWLGKYYFEIYVMQGVGMLLFHSNLIYVENKWIYVIICTFTTLILAVIIHPLFDFIGRFVKGKQ